MTPRTPLSQQSSSSVREEGRWVLMEDRRRRSAAFVHEAEEMLRYLENNEELKVGIAELQVAQQAGHEGWSKGI